MAATVRFTANPRFDHAIQPQLVNDLQRAADDLANDARTLARLRAFGEGPRHYADSIEGRAGMVGGEAVGRVVATKYTAHWLESGTRFMAPRRILRTAARRSGYRIGRSRSRR